MNLAKHLLVAGVLALPLFGCSRKQDASKPGAIDGIQPGQDIAWADGSVMTVTRREGHALEGVRIVRMLSTGQATVISANKGTIEPGADAHSVNLTLYEATTRTGNNEMSAHLLRLAFTK